MDQQAEFPTVATIPPAVQRTANWLQSRLSVEYELIDGSLNPRPSLQRTVVLLRQKNNEYRFDISNSASKTLIPSAVKMARPPSRGVLFVCMACTALKSLARLDSNGIFLLALRIAIDNTSESVASISSCHVKDKLTLCN